ncbi:unnamed protein product [Ectocarpus sp. 4 AP-2014]
MSPLKDASAVGWKAACTQRYCYNLCRRGKTREEIYEHSAKAAFVGDPWTKTHSSGLVPRISTLFAGRVPSARDAFYRHNAVIKADDGIGRGELNTRILITMQIEAHQNHHR